MSYSCVEIKIRGYHIDTFGVVNHAWFIRLFSSEWTE